MSLILSWLLSKGCVFLKVAAPYITIGGLILGAIWYVGSLKGEVQDARASESIARSNAEAQAAAVVVLGQQRLKVEEAAHARDTELQHIAKRLRDSESQVREARQHDPAYQSWADTPHPDAVGRRLRAREAATP